MTSSDSLNLEDLIRRVEAAEGPDRELDKSIARALDQWEAEPVTGIAFLCGRPFTASLDAALALCERVLPGAGLSLNIGAFKEATIWPAKPGRAATAQGRTPALALCLSLLRAVQAQDLGGKDE